MPLRLLAALGSNHLELQTKCGVQSWQLGATQQGEYQLLVLFFLT